MYLFRGGLSHLPQIRRTAEDFLPRLIQTLQQAGSVPFFFSGNLFFLQFFRKPCKDPVPASIAVNAHLPNIIIQFIRLFRGKLCQAGPDIMIDRILRKVLTVQPQCAPYKFHKGIQQDPLVLIDKKGNAQLGKLAGDKRLIVLQVSAYHPDIPKAIPLFPDQPPDDPRPVAGLLTHPRQKGKMYLRGRTSILLLRIAEQILLQGKQGTFPAKP